MQFRAVSIVFAVLLVCFIYIAAAFGRQSSTVSTIGYVRVIADPGMLSPAGVAIFGLRTNNVLVTEAAVPSKTLMTSGRIFAEIGSGVNTGIALANVGDQDAVISFYFTDTTGRDSNAGSFTLTRNRQIASFLTEQPFGFGSSSNGTFTFYSSVPVSAIALRNFVNERGEVLITTVPVSPLGSGFGGVTLLFPPLPTTGNITSHIVLVNPGDTILTGSVQYFAQGSKLSPASSLKVLINGTVSSTFDYSIAPHSAFRLTTQITRGTTQIGSAWITPTGNTPSSIGILTYETGGTTISTVSISALPAAKTFRMYTESSGSFGAVESIQTAFSISNSSATRVPAQLSITKLDGTPAAAPISLDVPANGQFARNIHELFPQLPQNFKGVLKVSAPSPLVLIGLRNRYNERGELLMTATPSYDDTSAAVRETDFPHFVSGGGYSTQLVLMSTGPGQTGSLSLIAQDGSTLPSSTIQLIP
jgi:hypothetical protein